MDNINQSCPALMSDGRGSVITDYISKNETLKKTIGSSTNSYQYRSKLQKTGFTDLTDLSKYNTCGTTSLGDIKFNKNIQMDYITTGNFKDAFKQLTIKK